jgi:hypothetical protein
LKSEKSDQKGGHEKSDIVGEDSPLISQKSRRSTGSKRSSPDNKKRKEVDIPGKKSVSSRFKSGGLALSERSLLSIPSDKLQPVDSPLLVPQRPLIENKRVSPKQLRSLKKLFNSPQEVEEYLASLADTKQPTRNIVQRLNFQEVSHKKSHPVKPDVAQPSAKPTAKNIPVKGSVQTKKFVLPLKKPLVVERKVLPASRKPAPVQEKPVYKSVTRFHKKPQPKDSRVLRSNGKVTPVKFQTERKKKPAANTVMDLKVIQNKVFAKKTHVSDLSVLQNISPIDFQKIKDVSLHLTQKQKKESLRQAVDGKESPKKFLSQHKMSLRSAQPQKPVFAFQGPQTRNKTKMLQKLCETPGIHPQAQTAKSFVGGIGANGQMVFFAKSPKKPPEEERESSKGRAKPRWR